MRGQSNILVLIAVIFAAGTLVTSILAFLSCYSTGLKSISFMNLDLTQIDIAGVTKDEIYASNEVYNYYRVGVNGYCYGSGPTDIEDCVSPEKPFWFDIQTYLGDSDLATTILSQLPSRVYAYQKTLRTASKVMWGFFLAAIICSAGTVFFGILSMCLPVLGLGNFFTSFLSMFTVVSAGIATGMFRVYSNRFKNTFAETGITAGVEKSGLAVVWVGFALAFLAVNLWNCCAGQGRRA